LRVSKVASSFALTKIVVGGKNGGCKGEEEVERETEARDWGKQGGQVSSGLCMKLPSRGKKDASFRGMKGEQRSTRRKGHGAPGRDNFSEKS